MFKRKDDLDNEDMIPYDYIQTEQDKKSLKKKFIIISTSVFLVLLIAFGVFVFSLFNVKKNYAYVASFVHLPDPVQVETSGEIVKSVGGYEISYELKASYTITGLVVEKYYYFPSKIENRISRFDLGIVWGPLLAENLKEYMTFKNNGNRFLQYKYSNALAQKLGGKGAVINSLSNNHMIHADETVLKYLRNVKEGDYIKVEGYLVYVTMKSQNNTVHWDSSLSRTDHGDGACEVIYVTNITWLKLK